MRDEHDRDLDSEIADAEKHFQAYLATIQEKVRSFLLSESGLDTDPNTPWGYIANRLKLRSDHSSDTARLDQIATVWLAVVGNNTEKANFRMDCLVKGVLWKLYQDRPNDIETAVDKMLTMAECPYYARRRGEKANIVLFSGYLTGRIGFILRHKHLSATEKATKNIPTDGLIEKTIENGEISVETKLMCFDLLERFQNEQVEVIFTDDKKRAFARSLLKVIRNIDREYLDAEGNPLSLLKSNGGFNKGNLIKAAIISGLDAGEQEPAASTSYIWADRILNALRDFLNDPSPA